MRRLNPTATLLRTTRGVVDPGEVLGTGLYNSEVAAELPGWAASRPDLAAVWSRAGPNLVIEPAQLWASAHETPGQEIVFIGIRLDPGGPRRILEPALLTDDELASGPTAWVRFDDPLPAWDAVHRH